MISFFKNGTDYSDHYDPISTLAKAHTGIIFMPGVGHLLCIAHDGAFVILDSKLNIHEYVFFVGRKATESEAAHALSVVNKLLKEKKCR